MFPGTGYIRTKSYLTAQDARHCSAGGRPGPRAARKADPLEPSVASAKRRMMYCAPGPLITAACKLEGKINRRNDLEPPVRGWYERGWSGGAREGGWTRKRSRGSHKGDERKSGAIRMMPFARSSSLDLPLPAATPVSPPPE